MSDSDDLNDLVSNNMFTFQNSNTTVHAKGPTMNSTNFTSMSFRNNNMLTSTMHMSRNFERPGYTEPPFDQRSYRSRSPMSLCSASDFGRRRNFNNSYYHAGMSSHRSMINGRGGSPMSVRSIDSNASVSAADIALAFKIGNFNNCDLRMIKEAYNKCMKSRLRRKVEKRRNKRLFLKGSRRKSGYDSGELGSNSSISSDDGKSVRTNLQRANSSCGSGKSNLTELRQTMKENQLYRDCTEDVRKSTFRNMVTSNTQNIKPAQRPSHAAKHNTTQKYTQPVPTMTQKERFKNGFLLPSQRFNKSIASTCIPEKNNAAPLFKKPSNSDMARDRPMLNGHESYSDQEEIFSERTIREDMPEKEPQRKRNLTVDHQLCSDVKRTKLLSPVQPNFKQNSDVLTKTRQKEADFQFAKPQFPIRKPITSKTKERVISMSAPPLGLTEVIQPMQSLPTRKSQDVQNKHQEEEKDEVSDLQETTQLSISDISNRPSFIKRKLYTQKLDVAENKNVSTDSMSDSPQPNSYRSLLKEKHKSRKLVTNQSCLNHEKLDEGNNLLDLIHKIVPRDQMNVTNLTNKSDIHNNKSKPDKWDVSSVISNCNKDDESDTYTDEDIFKMNETVKASNTDKKITNETIEASNVNDKNTNQTVKATNADKKKAKETIKASNTDKKNTIETVKASNVNNNKNTNETVTATNADKKKAKETVKASNTDKKQTDETLKASNADKKNTNETVKATNADKKKAKETVKAYNTDKKQTNETVKASNADKKQTNETVKATNADKKHTTETVAFNANTKNTNETVEASNVNNKKTSETVKTTNADKKKETETVKTTNADKKKAKETVKASNADKKKVLDVKKNNVVEKEPLKFSENDDIVHAEIIDNVPKNMNKKKAIQGNKKDVSVEKYTDICTVVVKKLPQPVKNVEQLVPAGSGSNVAEEPAMAFNDKDSKKKCVYKCVKSFWDIDFESDIEISRTETPRRHQEDQHKEEVRMPKSNGNAKLVAEKTTPIRLLNKSLDNIHQSGKIKRIRTPSIKGKENMSMIELTNTKQTKFSKQNATNKKLKPAIGSLKANNTILKSVHLTLNHSTDDSMNNSLKLRRNRIAKLGAENAAGNRKSVEQTTPELNSSLSRSLRSRQIDLSLNSDQSISAKSKSSKTTSKKAPVKNVKAKTVENIVQPLNKRVRRSANKENESMTDINKTKLTKPNKKLKYTLDEIKTKRTDLLKRNHSTNSSLNISLELRQTRTKTLKTVYSTDDSNVDQTLPNLNNTLSRNLRSRQIDISISPDKIISAKTIKRNSTKVATNAINNNIVKNIKQKISRKVK